MKVFLVEGFKDELTPDMKYYAFDWDDNLMYMPTQIILKDSKGNEVGMGTEDFAEHRMQVGKEDFEYKGKTIVGFAENPFRNFSESGDKKFIIDSLLAKTGPAWDDFVECINGGSIFSIVTARGHSPATIKQSIENLIELGYKGLSKKELVRNLKKYREISGEEDLSDSELVEQYLNMNKYYPVTYGAGSAQNPEQGKVNALKEFTQYVKSMASKLKQQPYLKNEISNNFIPTIGFSDDDLRNLEKIKQSFKDDPENIIQTYSTHGGVKKKY